MKVFALLLLALLTSASSALAQTGVYVSPEGNNSNKGTKTAPFATIDRAQVFVRSIKGPVVVYLRAGTYYLKNTIVFTEADSRKANEAVTYEAFPGEKVTISGAQPIKKLNWQPYQNGIFQTKVNADLLFDQLFVNGELQRMARYPNYNPDAKYLGGTAEDAISPERAARWKHPEGGYVHALHKSMWGDFHYLITGIDAKGEPILEGGWQNNRRTGMHKLFRFVENEFEELDAVNEWYYNKATKTLYYYPPKGVNLATAKVETPQLRHLVEFRGTEQKPVSNIHIEGVELTQTLRTFMDNKEPLLRSDWTTYRGGAVFFTGAVNCSIKNCFINLVGGNAVYFSNYNRDDEVSGCRIYKAGASGVSFVGDPAAVRSPLFEYSEFNTLDKIDRTPGPKTNNYPARILVYNNLIERTGETEKQSAGVQISMSQDITVSHNTIDDVPRAGINVNEGTWGGHIIEFNDVFNTVLETGDHGSFNSWGRDRYWLPNKRAMDTLVDNHPELVLLDVVKPITIRNNRFRCDHGWDIDLDDGSSNYRIYNNLLLNGGLKLREGVDRIAENNIIINNTIFLHVWFKHSDDVLTKNVIFRDYQTVGLKPGKWGKEIDYNIFLNRDELKKSQTGPGEKDAHAVYTPALFVNAAQGDYRLKNPETVASTGFKNFAMDEFGVVSPALKAVANKITLPVINTSNVENMDQSKTFMGLKVKDLNTLGERSATGMATETGVIVLEVGNPSIFKNYLYPGDVILGLNNLSVSNTKTLLQTGVTDAFHGSLNMVIFRDQKEQRLVVVVK
jgi:hypothetical protein